MSSQKHRCQDWTWTSKDPWNSRTAAWNRILGPLCHGVEMTLNKHSGNLRELQASGGSELLAEGRGPAVHQHQNITVYIYIAICACMNNHNEQQYDMRSRIRGVTPTVNNPKSFAKILFPMPKVSSSVSSSKQGCTSFDRCCITIKLC